MLVIQFLTLIIIIDNNRSDDGNTLVITSFDGFCSIMTFEEGELGERSHVVEN